MEDFPFFSKTHPSPSPSILSVADGNLLENLLPRSSPQRQRYFSPVCLQAELHHSVKCLNMGCWETHVEGALCTYTGAPKLLIIFCPHTPGREYIWCSWHATGRQKLHLYLQMKMPFLTEVQEYATEECTTKCLSNWYSITSLKIRAISKKRTAVGWYLVPFNHTKAVWISHVSCSKPQQN